MLHIQHGATCDRKVNKDNSCCFRIRSIFWSCLRYNKYRTDLRLTRLPLFTPSARSPKSWASALDFSLRTEGVNNYGLVTLRSVLSISGAIWFCHIPFCPEVKGMPSFEWLKIKEWKTSGNSQKFQEFPNPLISACC